LEFGTLQQITTYFALLNVPALVLVVNVLARFASLFAEELAE
jgi:hypothetical protein